MNRSLVFQGLLFASAFAMDLDGSLTALAWGGCACDPDVTQNGIVDDIDMAEIEGCMGAPPTNHCARADVDCDGDIDGDDLDAWGCMSGGGEASWCCPFVVNLEQFPFILAESPANGEMTGAAVLQSTLNYIWADDTKWFYDNQVGLYNNVNTDGLPGLSAAEVFNALKGTRQPSLIPLPYSSYGYNFNLKSKDIRILHSTPARGIA